jgi:NDP-sugar pyrophosphorylase family protein
VTDRLPRTAAGELQVLVLAGGLGTRLGTVVGDRPKVLAPVGERVFLDVLLEQFEAQGLQSVVLLLGHRHEQVEAHLRRPGAVPPGMAVTVSIEPQPLGTAGAIGHARRWCTRTFLVVNGDTFIDVDLAGLLDAHGRQRAAVTIAAVRTEDAGRFGALEVEEPPAQIPGGGSAIRGFREKDAAVGPGLINGGVYVIQPEVVAEIPAGRAVSFERETLPGLLAAGARLWAVPQQGAFVDIGTPSSWAGFQRTHGAAGALAKR